MNWEIDPMFITAILAIMGYSVNDTIVVLDRIGKISKGISPDFGTTVNYSLTQTLARVAKHWHDHSSDILAVYLFVGGPISHFLIGFVCRHCGSTYSSFLASQLLVVWEKGEWKRFLPRIPFRRFRKA